jgi:chromosome segregation ATPase
MAMPALKLELEIPVEERVARLEEKVEHIQSDVSEIKRDLRRLNDKVDDVDKRLGAKIDDVDKRLNAKIDNLDQKLSAKIDSLDQKQVSLALTMEKGFAELKIGRALDRVWWLLMLAALLGVMARAFKWL